MMSSTVSARFTAQVPSVPCGPLQRNPLDSVRLGAGRVCGEDRRRRGPCRPTRLCRCTRRHGLRSAFSTARRSGGVGAWCAAVGCFDDGGLPHRGLALMSARGHVGSAGLLFNRFFEILRGRRGTIERRGHGSVLGWVSGRVERMLKTCACLHVQDGVSAPGGVLSAAIRVSEGGTSTK